MHINVTEYRGRVVLPEEGVHAELGREPINEHSQPVPLVLIHGFPVDHRMWDQVAAEIIARSSTDAALATVPLYAFDMPGAAKSPIPTAEQTGAVAADGAYLEAQSRLAAAFVDTLHSLGYERAVWVGLSMGGYVVLSIQKHFPDAIAGLGLCDTKVEADSEQARRRRLDSAAATVGAAGLETVMHFAQPEQGDSEIKKSPAFVAKFTRWIQEQNPDGIAWRQRMAAGRPHQAEVLETITVPTLVLSGALDPSSPPTKMKPLARKIRNAFFVEIAQAGHFSAVEQPEEVAGAIITLLKKSGVSEAAR